MKKKGLCLVHPLNHYLWSYPSLYLRPVRFPSVQHLQDIIWGLPRDLIVLDLVKPKPLSKTYRPGHSLPSHYFFFNFNNKQAIFHSSWEDSHWRVRLSKTSYSITTPNFPSLAAERFFFILCHRRSQKPALRTSPVSRL